MTVVDNGMHYAHTYKQFLKISVGLGLVFAFV